MPFHAADVQKLQDAGGAALRMYEKLTAEAEGCQDGSVNAMRKVMFEQAWSADPQKVIAECEAMEGDVGEPQRLADEKVENLKDEIEEEAEWVEDHPTKRGRRK